MIQEQNTATAYWSETHNNSDSDLFETIYCTGAAKTDKKQEMLCL